MMARNGLVLDSRTVCLQEGQNLLVSSLWQSLGKARCGMAPSQYKDYVLTLLFIKRVSESHTGRPDAFIEVHPGGGFADIAKLKGNKENDRTDNDAGSAGRLYRTSWLNTLSAPSPGMGQAHCIESTKLHSLQLCQLEIASLMFPRRSRSSTSCKPPLRGVAPMIRFLVERNQIGVRCRSQCNSKVEQLFRCPG